jgi:hypothetical protein
MAAAERPVATSGGVTSRRSRAGGGGRVHIAASPTPARAPIDLRRASHAVGPPTGAALTRSTATAFAGVALATLAAAGVAAIVNHRRGSKPDPGQHAHLDELGARLAEAADSSHAPSGRIRRMLDTLQRNQGISPGRLQSWISGVRQGTLDTEQATVAESDFATLERQADQDGV